MVRISSRSLRRLRKQIRRRAERKAGVRFAGEGRGVIKVSKPSSVKKETSSRSRSEPRILIPKATTTSTASGGTRTVTTKGLVTIRDKDGGLISRSQISTRRAKAEVRQTALQQRTQTTIKTKQVSNVIQRMLQRQAIKTFEKDPRATRVKVVIDGVSAEFERAEKFGGVLRQTERSKKLAGRISRFKDITLSKIQSRKTGATGRILRGVFVLGALGLARGLLGVVDTIRKPKEVIKGQIQAIRHPIETINLLGNQFKVDPVGTVAEFWVYGKALNTIGKGVKRSPVGRFVHEQMFIRSQPKQIRPAVRKIIKASKIQEKLNPSNIPSIKKADFMQIKSLTKVEGRALIKALNKNEVIFGSLASRLTAGKKFKSKLPIPKDVDLATKNVANFNQRFINALPKNTRSNYLVKAEKIIRKSNGETLLDVKPLSRLIPDKGIISRRGLLPVSGYVRKLTISKKSLLPKIKRKAISGAFEVPTQKIQKVKVGKKTIRVVGFGEQTTRKGLGTLQVLIEKNVRRAKDPQSFLIGLEVQKAFLKSQKTKTAFGRLRINRKVKALDGAIDLLMSRGFSKLLDKKVPGLTKQFPLVKKFNTFKLKKINPNKARIIAKRINKVLLKQIKFGEKVLSIPEKAISLLSKKLKNRFRSIVKKRHKKTTKIQPRKKLPTKVLRARVKKLSIKKISRLPTSDISRLPIKKISRLPTNVISRLPLSIIRRLPRKIQNKVRKKTKPSRIPKKKPSKLQRKIPSRLPSRLPRKRQSKLPSKLPKGRPSKLPRRKHSRLPSKLPKKTPSRLPSRLPKGRPSRLPSRVPSKLPSKLPIKKVKLFKIKKKFSKKKFKKKVKKLVKKSLSRQRFVFVPDIESVILGIRASPAERKALLKVGKIFTGFERRKIV